MAMPFSFTPADRAAATFSHCKWLSTCLSVLVTQVYTEVDPLKELAAHTSDMPALEYFSSTDTENAVKHKPAAF